MIRKKIKTIFHRQCSSSYAVNISFLNYDCSLVGSFPRETIFTDEFIHVSSWLYGVHTERYENFRRRAPYLETRVYPVGCAAEDRLDVAMCVRGCARACKVLKFGQQYRFRSKRTLHTCRRLQTRRSQWSQSVRVVHVGFWRETTEGGGNRRNRRRLRRIHLVEYTHDTRSWSRRWRARARTSTFTYTNTLYIPTCTYVYSAAHISLGHRIIYVYTRKTTPLRCAYSERTKVITPRQTLAREHA